MERYDAIEITWYQDIISYTTKRKGLYMDVDREQLQKLREQIGRKAHLTSMLDNLYVQEKEQKEKVEELRQEKEDEQKDVDRLEDRGLTALFYSLIGKIDEKMTKEQKEAYAASVKYEAANQELKAIQYHIHTYVKELDYLKGCEATYIQTKRTDCSISMNRYLPAAAVSKNFRKLFQQDRKPLLQQIVYLASLIMQKHGAHGISSAAVYSAQQPNTATWTMPRAILPNSRWISDTSTQN